MGQFLFPSWQRGQKKQTGKTAQSRKKIWKKRRRRQCRKVRTGSMKKFNRWVMVLAVAGGIFSSTATTAFAYVPDPYQTEAATEPVSENEGAVIPEQEAAGQTEGTPQEETQGGETPFSIPGNGEVLDDKTGDGTKEFLTIQTKNGNTFFLVLDRSSNTENVYMLSMVDENDLAEFLDETKTEEAPQ